MPNDPLAASWNRIAAELRGAVTDSTWQLWLSEVRAREVIGDTLVVEAPDNVRTAVAERFGRLLQACAATRPRPPPAPRVPPARPPSSRASR